jgi:hypothetical protein
MIRPSELAFDIDGVFADTMSLFIDIARMDFGISGIRYEDITEYDINGFAGVDETIVFKQPWNLKLHPFLEVENWQELESLIAFE